MTLFVKSVRARRVERHQQKLNPLGAKLAAVLPRQAIPDDNARNRKLLAKKANYYGHEPAGGKIIKEIYDAATDTSTLCAI